jgi:TPR repeat protein
MSRRSLASVNGTLVVAGPAAGGWALPRHQRGVANTRAMKWTRRVLTHHRSAWDHLEMDELVVFLASPSDVSPERERVAGVIDEVNGLARPGEPRLRLVRWEVDVRPGVGEDPQDVVNRQVGDAHITLVVFWKRLGTPTKRAEAGTVEEFNRAVERWREEPRREVLTYFKTEPIDLYADDLEQAARVREFRRRIAGTTLSKEFRFTAEFEKQVRNDLTRAVRDWAQHDAIERPPAPEDAERDPHAAFALGLLARSTDRADQARHWLERAAEQGHIGATVDLALMLRQGGALDDADYWFRRAAERGDATAIYNVGLRHRERGERALAEDWLRRAAELSDVAAKYNLGLVLREGGDDQESETWLRQAAEGGDVAAMYNLGLALRDRGEMDGAELWLRRGAEGGDPAAMRDLGLHLEQNGHREEAEEWLRRGADGGDNVAARELARLNVGPGR